MWFTLFAIGPGVVLFLVYMIGAYPHYENHPLTSIGVAGLVWVFVAIPICRRYWRTRVSAKAWKDARGGVPRQRLS